MRLIWKQMLSFMAVMVVLVAIMAISFISVTNRTMYQHTFNELNQYADSLIQDNEILIDRKNNQIVGFEEQAIDSKSRLLSAAGLFVGDYRGLDIQPLAGTLDDETNRSNGVSNQVDCKGRL